MYGFGILKRMHVLCVFGSAGNNNHIGYIYDIAISRVARVAPVRLSPGAVALGIIIFPLRSRFSGHTENMCVLLIPRFGSVRYGRAIWTNV